MLKIEGHARLGKSPELKYIGEGDDKQAVCEMSVKFINSKKKKDSDEYEDFGFWAQLNVWGHEAEPAAKLLAQGDRIFIADGKLAEKSWPDKNDADKINKIYQVDCRYVFPVLSDMESISYKSRASKS